MERTPARRLRSGLVAGLLVAGLAGCGDDGGSDGTTTVPTTPRPLEEYRAQYLELLTAERCSDQQTVAVQDDIAPDGTVGPGDFPALQERLFPAWGARADAIADFQAGLAGRDWSDELTPLVDDLIAEYEEARASYRAAARIETFEDFAAFVFPADGEAEGELRAALELPTDQDDGIDWCAGIPPLGPTTTTSAEPLEGATTSSVAPEDGTVDGADGEAPPDGTTTPSTPDPTGGP